MATEKHLAELVELNRQIASFKAIEKKLRESEKRFSTIMENVHDVIFRLSPSGHIEYVNPKVKELYGYDPEDLIGEHLKKTTPAKDVPKALQALKRVLSGEAIYNFEIDQLDSKEKIIHVDINIVPLKEKGKVVAIQGLMRDITKHKKTEDELRKYQRNLEKIIENRTVELKKINEMLEQDISKRKQAEQMLRDSERRYRQLVDSSPNPIFAVDRGGHIQLWNPASKKIYQYDADEVVGQTYHKLLPTAESVSQVEKMLNRVLRRTSLDDQKITFRCKDGTQRQTISRMYPLITFHGRIQGCVFTNTDITGCLQIKEGLRTICHMT